MSVHLEFINFIIPVHVIKEKYPGGWKKCLSDHENLIGGRVWYDDYLFRDGAMNPGDIQHLIDEWSGMDFITHTEVDNKPTKWVDVCVVEGMFGGATLECDWIEVDAVGGFASLKEKPAGDVISRESFGRMVDK